MIHHLMREAACRLGIAGKYIIKYCSCCILATAFLACATAPVPVTEKKQDNVLVLVDGDPITREDLKYSIEVAHRREDLSSAKSLDINKYIEKLINDRLIVQEARRMGMDSSPAVQEKVRSYVIRESVMRLYNDEILSKAAVSEKDILDYYRNAYERFTLGIIEVDTLENAEVILGRIKDGELFEVLSREYRGDNREHGNGDYVMTKKSMPPAIRDSVSSMDPGEMTDIVPMKDKFYIVRVLGREMPPVGELKDVRASIEDILKKRKIQERSDEYLAQLHRQSDISVDRKLLSSIDFSKGKKEIDALKLDTTPLVHVNGEVLSVSEFAGMISSSDEAAKRKVLKRWLDRKLVDLEALRRGYDLNTDLEGKLQSYKNQLIKKAFFRDVIAVKVDITDSEVKEYYQKHREDYVMPVRYKIQKISLKSLEDAEEVIKSLDEGANFSWMAKKKSIDTLASQGGVMGWKARENLLPPVKKVIDKLAPGDYSRVLRVDDEFIIVRLMEKTEGRVEDFKKVRELVYRALHRERFSAVYDTYVEKLRGEARIDINDEAVRSFKKIFER